jgi:hypothetical protein
VNISEAQNHKAKEHGYGFSFILPQSKGAGAALVQRVMAATPCRTNTDRKIRLLAIVSQSPLLYSPLITKGG